MDGKELKARFWRVTKWAACIVGLALLLAFQTARWEGKAQDKRTAYVMMLSDLYNKAHPNEDRGLLWGDRRGYFNDCLEYARKKDPQLVHDYEWKNEQIEDYETWKRRFAFTAAAAAIAYAVAAVGFGVAAMSRRTQTRGQRAGLVAACSSIVFPAWYWFSHGRLRYFFESVEGLLFFILAGAGILLLLGVPQKLRAWIAGGAKD